jgi:hypothetical protein
MSRMKDAHVEAESRAAEVAYTVADGIRDEVELLIRIMAPIASELEMLSGSDLLPEDQALRIRALWPQSLRG